MALKPSEAESEADHARLENLGRFVRGELMTSQFKVIVCSMPLAGIIDVTHWTPEAVRVLLTVCRDRSNVIALRAGIKYFTPVIPEDGHLLDMLIQIIIEAGIEFS